MKFFNNFQDSPHGSVPSVVRSHSRLASPPLHSLTHIHKSICTDFWLSSEEFFLLPPIFPLPPFFAILSHYGFIEETR